MPTANERKALWFLAFVALSGTAVRLWRSNAAPVPVADARALARQIGRVDSARAAGKAGRSNREKRGKAATKVGGDSPPIDLDRATVAEIERLPGIGPALAERIVASRDSHGSFGDLNALCEVRGIGPALAERLRPLVTFTGARRPVSVACGDASRRIKKPRAASVREPR